MRAQCNVFPKRKKYLKAISTVWKLVDIKLVGFAVMPFQLKIKQGKPTT